MTDTTTRGAGHVPAYRVIPQIADQVADELDEFERARALLDRLNAENRARAAELDALNRDTDTDPGKLVARRSELAEAQRRGNAEAAVAERQARTKRSALNNACERALRSPESIRLRRELAERFHEETVARYAEAFDRFRAELVEIRSAQKFVTLSIASELRTIDGARRSGNFDAEARTVTVPQDVDHALAGLLDTLARFPYVAAVRSSIIGEGGYDRLTDWEWSADTLPASVRETIAAGLEPRVARSWLRGEHPRTNDRVRPSSRSSSSIPETV